LKASGKNEAGGELLLHLEGEEIRVGNLGAGKCSVYLDADGVAVGVYGKAILDGGFECGVGSEAEGRVAGTLLVDDARGVAGTGAAEAIVEDTGAIFYSVIEGREVQTVEGAAETTTEDGLLMKHGRCPGEAELWFHACVVGIEEAVVWREGWRDELAAGGAKDGQVEELTFVAEGTEVFVAQAGVEGERRADLPVILNEETKRVGAEISSGDGSSASDRIRLDTFVDGSIVGKVEEFGEGIDGTSIAAEVVVVLFPAIPPSLRVSLAMVLMTESRTS
jgi:hypothetical protein